jgi:transcriptional regulator with XRE-family HTH domain
MTVKQKPIKHYKKGYFVKKASPAAGKWGLAGKKGGSLSKKIDLSNGINVHDAHGQIMAVGGSELFPGIQLGAEEAAPFAASGAVETERELAEELVDELDRTGSDVKTLSKEYGLTREELGRLTGFSIRALAEWAADKIPSQPAQRRLHELRRLLEALSQLVDKRAIPAWLHKRNPAFDNITPLQVIELGEIDRIWAMIYDMGAGQPE